MRGKAASAFFLCLVITPSPGAGLGAQSFSLRVVEKRGEQNVPVPTTIEYERAGVWRRLRGTHSDGTLTGTCPGSVAIRANGWPAFRPSDEELCGGSHDFLVIRRPVRSITGYLAATDAISLEMFAQAHARAAVAEERNSPDGTRSTDLAILEQYLERPERLSATEREIIETTTLNSTVSEFIKIDADRNGLISSGELDRATAGPD